MLSFQKVDVRVGKVPILSHISVGFEKGKITTLIGPNGCGKTTLLQTLNGMSTVTAGRITIDDMNFLRLSMRERAKLLSFMPQFRDAAPGISVKGLVEHGRFPYMGFSRRMSPEDEEAIEYALEYTNLNEYRNYMVNELSGGLQQRVYLAMQLAQNSPYMVMDEPMNYLDFPGQREMYDLIKDLGNKGRTIILVLHDIGQALQISDHMVIMNHREIVCSGTPMECLEKGMIQRVFQCEINGIDIEGKKRYILL